MQKRIGGLPIRPKQSSLHRVVPTFPTFSYPPRTSQRLSVRGPLYFSSKEDVLIVTLHVFRVPSPRVRLAQYLVSQDRWYVHRLKFTTSLQQVFYLKSTRSSVGIKLLYQYFISLILWSWPWYPYSITYFQSKRFHHLADRHVTQSTIATVYPSHNSVLAVCPGTKHKKHPTPAMRLPMVSPNPCINHYPAQSINQSSSPLGNRCLCQPPASTYTFL
jgi:hypothetical protein